MYPTRAQVKARFQNILDDPSGSVFSEPVFAPAFGEAYDALFTAFLTNQCPRIEMIAPFTVPAGTTSLTPAQMGIADFSDYIYLSERITGSQDEYRDLADVDRLSQRPATDRLLEFNYRNDTFYFNGSSNSIDLLMKYDSSGEAPTDDDAQIIVDSSLTFLSNYAVGVAGGRKGYDEIAQRCLTLSVGPKYDLGTVGGELFRLIQSRVRSRQKVQIAPKPYSSTRRLQVRRAVPYVAAPVTVPAPVSPAQSSLTLQVNGTLATGTNLAPVVEWQQATLPSAIVAIVNQAPQGGSLLINIKVAGVGYTSIAIPAGQNQVGTVPGALAALPPIPANTPIGLDILAVGTTSPGGNLSIFLYA